MIQVLLNSAPRFQADGPLAEIASMKSADHEQVRERSGGGQPGPSPVSDLDRLDDPRALVDDTALLARLEGLEAHARAAEVRSGEDPGQASSPSSRIADATSTNRGQPDQSFMSPALRRLGGGAPKMPFPPPLEPGASTSAP